MHRSVWPLAAMVVGLPLWWALGLAAVAPILLTVPMAAQLLRTRPLHLPSGFGWWLLFLVWVLLGVAVLWVDAPGAVPGADSSRLLVFGFRLSWYVACTVVLLWVTNLDRLSVPDRTLYAILGGLFVVATAGGLLGTLVPGLEFRSAIEWVLPGGLRGNPFISALVHPEAADIQQVLGVPGARPKAPFAYTNTWGSIMALSSVFLVAAVWRARGWQRTAAAAVAACAAVPIAYSLNRGLWLALAAAIVGGLVMLGFRRRPGQLVAALAVLVIAAGVLGASPLRELATQRFDSPHSNNRRGLLLTGTVASVSQGSPVVGFGSTRDVQGSFASIAGGATPQCPACGVPPLGTQGHLWLVLFSQGWFGLAFFMCFVALALARSWRCRTANQTVCTFVVGMFLLQLPIYDTLGLPLMVVMIAVGLVARERRTEAEHRTGAALVREIRRGAPVLAVSLVAGATVAVGVLITTVQPAYAGYVSVAFTPAPVYLDTGASDVATQSLVRRPLDITLDTEVALLLSKRAVGAVARGVDATPAVVRSMVSVTAVPNSHVLEIGVTSGRAAESERVAAAFADAYLRERRRYLDERRDHLLSRLKGELQSLDGVGTSARRAHQELSGAVVRLESSRPEIGNVVRSTPAAPRPRPVAVGATTGAGVGLLVGLVAMNLTANGTGIPRRRSRRGAHR